MGLRTMFLDWLEAARPKNEPDRRTDAFPWSIGNKNGQPMPKRTPANLRTLSESAIPRRAINVIKDGITQLNWSVSAIDEDDAEKHKELVAIIERCLLKPNQSDSFRTLMEQVVEDILVASAGAAEVLKAGDKTKPLRLYPVDSFSIHLMPDWDGKPTSYRYAQRDGNGKYIPLTDNELMYIRINPRTNTPFGLAPMETVWETVNNFIETHKSSGNQTKSTFLRKILNLGKSASAQDTKAFKAFWINEVAGKGETPIIAGESPSVLDLGAVDDKGLYIEWQRFLIEIIAVAFGISPKKLGQTKDINRNTADSEDDDTDLTIKSIAENIVEYINNEIIDGVFKMGGVLQFQFHYETRLKDLKTRADIDAIYIDRRVLTIDEVRSGLARPPLPNEHGEVVLTPSKTMVTEINQKIDRQKEEKKEEQEIKARWMKANSVPIDTEDAENDFNEAYLLLMLLLLRRGEGISSIDSLLFAWTPKDLDIDELSMEIYKLKSKSWLASFNRRRQEMAQGAGELSTSAINELQKLSDERSRMITDTYNSELQNKIKELELKHAALVGSAKEAAIKKEAEEWLTKRMAYKATQMSNYEAGEAWNMGLFAHDKQYSSDTEYYVLPPDTHHDECADIINNAPYTKDTLPAPLPLHPNCPHRYYALMDGD